MKRRIIKIDEQKCNGCGECIKGCPEGALQLIDGKARLINEAFCDGLGACIGECPLGAITIEEREAEPYNERVVVEQMIEQGENVLKAHLNHLKEHGQEDLLHEVLDFLKGSSLIVGCPKLDDAEYYIEKLSEIFKKNDIKKVIIAHMEVPCCFGLNHIVNKAISDSGKDIPIEEMTISIKGEILQEANKNLF